MGNKEKIKLKKSKLIVLLVIILGIVAIIYGNKLLNKKENNIPKKTYIEVEESFFDDISKREYEIIGGNVYLLKDKISKNHKYKDLLLSNFTLISNYLKTEYPEIKVLIRVYSVNESNNGISVFFNPIIEDCVVAEDTLAALGTGNGEVYESVVGNLEDIVEICKYDAPKFIDEENAKQNAINVFTQNRTQIEITVDQPVEKEYYLGFIEGTYYYSFDVGNSYVIVNAEDGQIIETSFDK